MSWERNRQRQKNKAGHCMAEKKSILVIDDVELNRKNLKDILQDEYSIYEAQNGEEALAVLGKCHAKLALIILDLVMPIMDGFTFLEVIKKDKKTSHIPVIVVTSRDDEEYEEKSLALGAQDFIAKPFNPSSVKQRILNTIYLHESIVVRNTLERDSLTALLNRKKFESLVEDELRTNQEKHLGKNYVFMMVDLDDFKNINDKKGHGYGDEMLAMAARLLKSCFRSTDYIARLGGDEFAVFWETTGNMESIVAKGEAVHNAFQDYSLKSKNMLTCSIGIAISREHGNTFSELYSKADKALYKVKQKGKNTYRIFREVDTQIFDWVDNPKYLLDEMECPVFVSENQSYKIVYANQAAMKLFGKEKEEFVGEKCYKLLGKRETPCNGCSVEKIRQAGVETRVIHFKDKGEYYLFEGKAVKWKGEWAHLEVAMKIPDYMAEQIRRFAKTILS